MASTARALLNSHRLIALLKALTQEGMAKGYAQRLKAMINLQLWVSLILLTISARGITAECLIQTEIVLSCADKQISPDPRLPPS